MSKKKDASTYIKKKEKGNSYVEQPYFGIWKLEDEVFS